MKKILFWIFIFFAAAGLLAGFFIDIPKKQAKLPDVIKPAQNNFHYSYFSQAGFYEQAYAAARQTPAADKSGIKGVLVNHHLFAASFIAETFNAVATIAPVTVLLISPNHFDAGKGRRDYFRGKLADALWNFARGQTADKSANYTGIGKYRGSPFLPGARRFGHCGVH